MLLLWLLSSRRADVGRPWKKTQAIPPIDGFSIGGIFAFTDWLFASVYLKARQQDASAIVFHGRGVE